MSELEARFARAFLAMSYVLGERGAALAPSLRVPEVERVRAALASAERADRARALAIELSRIALGLEQGALR